MALLIRSFNILVVCANPLPGSFASFFMIGKDWGDGVCVCVRARVCVVCGFVVVVDLCR